MTVMPWLYLRVLQHGTWGRYAAFGTAQFFLLWVNSAQAFQRSVAKTPSRSRIATSSASRPAAKSAAPWRRLSCSSVQPKSKLTS